MKYPDLIPGDQIDSENPRRWFFVGEEVHFPIVGGRTIRLDLLFLDQDGIPTLIELKRSEDDRLKSEVATQIMEYGANILLSMDTRIIRKMVESNDDTAIINFLDEGESEEEFWEKVYDNLKAEKIRLLVVADEIPNRLQNIIEFLNRNMESVTILAVEIKQYAKDDIKTLVPRVIGQSIETQSKKTERIGNPSILDEDTFFENLDQYGKEFYQKLFNFTKKQDLIVSYTAKGFTVNVPANGFNVSIFRGYSLLAAHGQHIVSTSGKIKSKVKNGDEILEEYVKEIMKIDGSSKVGDGFVFKIDKNLDEKIWEQFENTILNITEQIMKNGLKE
jgi:vacuolar-type H+-ATPase subunit F/Vma7